MKKLLLLAFLFPALVNAQVKPKAKKKPVHVSKASVEAGIADGFEINGEVTGFPDGAKISLLNGQTGAAEQQSGIYQNKFSFKGKLDKPAFKIIIVDQKPPI
ncbi:MAG: hypothetical protein IPP72_19765 [Chitinophagaceae bacterium]|nr:hypothetical protein [Chitinophagaceae bacterium]